MFSLGDKEKNRDEERDKNTKICHVSLTHIQSLAAKETAVFCG